MRMPLGETRMTVTFVKQPSTFYFYYIHLVLMLPAPSVQALCSIVVWYSPDVPNCNYITGYDVRLYTKNPQLPEQNFIRRVGSNCTFYIISDEHNLGNSDKTYYVQVHIYLALGFN